MFLDHQSHQFNLTSIDNDNDDRENTPKAITARELKQVQASRKEYAEILISNKSHSVQKFLNISS